ncbi:type II toxin-antitoxin system YoeB family toxin [Streptomyces sp. NPDC001220]
MPARINKLVEDLKRDPFMGMGASEPLKRHLSGVWLTQIDGRGPPCPPGHGQGDRHPRRSVQLLTETGCRGWSTVVIAGRPFRLTALAGTTGLGVIRLRPSSVWAMASAPSSRVRSSLSRIRWA